MAEERKVRRSGLTMPVVTPRFVNAAWTRGCDYINLDLEDSVPQHLKGYARGLIREAIDNVSKGGAEAFTRINHDLIQADLEGIIWPGLTKVNYPKAEHGWEIEKLDLIITRLERERGIRPGTVEIGANIETSVGVANCYEIASASPRVKEFGGATGYDMSRDLGVEMFVGFDQFVYGKGEVELTARALGLGSPGCALHCQRYRQRQRPGPGIRRGRGGQEVRFQDRRGTASKRSCASSQGSDSDGGGSGRRPLGNRAGPGSWRRPKKHGGKWRETGRHGLLTGMKLPGRRNCWSGLGCAPKGTGTRKRPWRERGNGKQPRNPPESPEGKLMAPLIRRSNLIVPVTDGPAVEDSWRYEADAVTLDLASGVTGSRKAEARSLVPSCIQQAAKGGAEVFVRVNGEFVQADTEAAVTRRGSAESFCRERRRLPRSKNCRPCWGGWKASRGLAGGELQIIILLETALGIWNVREILSCDRQGDPGWHRRRRTGGQHRRLILRTDWTPSFTRGAGWRLRRRP